MLSCKAKGKRQKAKGKSAALFLPFAFCLLPFAFPIRLPVALQLAPSAEEAP
jgi:hypothetical protein